MENEKFGVELELITKKFSEKLESVKSKVANFGKIAKQNFQTGMYMDVSKAKSDLQSLESELKELTSTPYEWTWKGNELVDTKERIKQVKAEISDLKSDINTFETSKISKLGQIFGSLKSKIEKISSSFKKVKSSASGFGSSVKSTFQQGIKSIKRFALSLVGIQSIWRGVSKASSAYLSQDTELSNKFQAVWVGIGSMLAPILEKLANFFIKLVSYLNVFVKALTGVDLLSKAMKKANDNTKATSSSVKKLKGQLAGFDEINNIADNDSGGSDTGSADTSWTSAFENVSLDTSWTEKITNFGTWMQENWEIVVGLILGTATAIELVKLGVGGLTSLGIGLILAGLVITIKSIVDFIKDPSWENFSNILIGLAVILAGVAVAMLAVNAANPVAWIMLAIAAIVAIVAVIIKNWDTIKETIKSCIDKIKNFFSGLWTSIKNIFGKVGTWFSEKFSAAWAGIKKAFSSVTSFFSNIWTTIKNMFSKIGTTVGNAIGEAFKKVVNSIISFAENTINGFIKAINVAIDLINLIPKVNIKKLSLLEIPKLATGTNYVPNDQLAYIHKGEAVVPKKFNSSEFFGSGNEETNALLRQLIEVVDEKDTNTYLDGKAIGKVARNYIVSQNRIMGRSGI